MHPQSSRVWDVKRDVNKFLILASGWNPQSGSGLATKAAEFTERRVVHQELLLLRMEAACLSRRGSHLLQNGAGEGRRAKRGCQARDSSFAFRRNHCHGAFRRSHKVPHKRHL